MIKRMWVNQPSRLQPLHDLHGTNVLYDVDQRVAFFLKGPVVSQIIPTGAPVLSEGWPEWEVKNKSYVYKVTFYPFKSKSPILTEITIGFQINRETENRARSEVRRQVSSVDPEFWVGRFEFELRSVNGN